MKIKVCGLTRAEQFLELDHMGIDYGGLIFYEPSSRYVKNRLTGDEVKALPLKMEKVGVFVDAELDTVLREVEAYGLGMVQLHGNESPHYCELLASLVKVMKVFRINEANENNIDWWVQPYADWCDYYLFDTEGAGYGGTGKKFNWQLLADNTIGKPFFLSGGIGLEDVQKIRSFQHPFLYGVDINSRFEVHPGFKDTALVDAFKKRLQAGATHHPSTHEHES